MSAHATSLTSPDSPCARAAATTSLSVVQLNMGRQAAVNDQLLHYCLSNHVDIALVQEPYTRQGRLVDLNAAPIRSSLSKGAIRPGSHALIHGAAIIVFNPRLKIVARPDLSTLNFAAAILSLGSSTVSCISGYFRYRHPTETHIAELRNLLDKLPAPWLISIDSNAHSTDWFCRRSNYKGRLVEDFIADYQLTCHNRPSALTTFDGPRGNTNIDLTLTSAGIAAMISSWRIIGDATTSDHNLLAFTLGGLSQGTFLTRRPRLNERLADWPLFITRLNSLLSSQPSSDSAEILSANLHQALIAASTAAIPRQHGAVRPKPPWWNSDISAARRALKSAARVRHLHPREYSSARNRFTALLRGAKSSSWKRFCSTKSPTPWGRLFHWMKSGSATHEIPSAITTADGTLTTNMDETVHTLLNSVIPNDPGTAPHDLDDGPHTYEPCTSEELFRALRNIRPNSSPGYDSITASIAKAAWPSIADHMLSITNACLRDGTFPSVWKKADLVIIKKPGKPDYLSPKAYRPISLLPVLAKTLEKAVVSRIHQETTPHHSGNQFGFTKGRSTLDAIQSLLSWPTSVPEKHVVAVLLDITGAFDSLNWQALLQDLRSLGASRSSCAVVRSYLANRTATLTIGGSRASVVLTRGCPQGSLFGPTLWNVTMEQLLLLPWAAHTKVQAYADDIALMISADTRQQLIRRAASALEAVSNWGRERELLFSPSKSTAVILKGGLVPGFSIPFQDHHITTVPSAKYLGVMIGHNASFRSHVRNLATTNVDLFSRLRTTLGSSWGSSRKTASLLYRAVFIPRVTYAARFWHHEVDTTVNRRILTTLQRRALLGISSAYRTTSNAALQVITGSFPLDLEAHYQALVQSSTSLAPTERKIALNAEHSRLLAIWQARWDSDTTGRWSHRFFPSIATRLKTPILLNHYNVQFLSGHGDFKAKLHSLGLTDSPVCGCSSGDETAEHVLYFCSRTLPFRERLELAVLRAGHLWPCPPCTLLSSRALFCAFDKFCQLALIDREDRP